MPSEYLDNFLCTLCRFKQVPVALLRSGLCGGCTVWCRVSCSLSEYDALMLHNRRESKELLLWMKEINYQSLWPTTSVFVTSGFCSNPSQILIAPPQDAEQLSTELSRQNPNHYMLHMSSCITQWPVSWPVEWWYAKQNEDVRVCSTAKVLFKRLGWAGVELIISKASRSEGEIKASVSADGLRKEVQTFIGCNAKEFKVQTSLCF